MDIGSKAKNLFNELIEIPFSLLYLLETPNESKRDYQNNTMDLITPAETFIPIRGTRIPPIDMSNHAYRPGFVGPHDDEPRDYN